jgi:hypothetical protein
MSRLQMAATALAIASLVACYTIEAAIRHAANSVAEVVASDRCSATIERREASSEGRA